MMAPKLGISGNYSALFRQRTRPKEIWSGMRNIPPVRFTILLSLLWIACDQDINTVKDQPLVDYTVLVTDGASSVSLDSVKVRVFTATGDTSTFFTDAAEGLVKLPTVASSRTLFVLSRKEYRTTNFIDTVPSAPDTVFHRPIMKLLMLKMMPLPLSNDRESQESRSSFSVNLADSEFDSKPIWLCYPKSVVGFN
jgi:hypothetical protein